MTSHSTNLADLRRDHANLARLCEEIGSLVASDQPPPSIELFDARRRLRRSLLAHLEAEDRHLYPGLRASADRQVREIAERFVEEMGGLASAFESYGRAWDPDRTEREWPEYQRETRALLVALKTRIERENRELYPLLESSTN